MARWIDFEEWQLMAWWMKGMPIDEMPGEGENQPKLTDFLTEGNEDKGEYEWDVLKVK